MNYLEPLRGNIFYYNPDSFPTNLQAQCSTIDQAHHRTLGIQASPKIKPQSESNAVGRSEGGWNLLRKKSSLLCQLLRLHLGLMGGRKGRKMNRLQVERRKKNKK